MVGVLENLEIYTYISTQHSSSIASLIASPKYHSAVIPGLLIC